MSPACRTKPLVSEAPYNIIFLNDVVNGNQISYLIACLSCLLAKPVHNLALRVFQRYSDELCQALGSCVDEVATVLYNNKLVTWQERNQVKEGLGLTIGKAANLVQAIERKLVAENSFAPLKTFCQVLRRCHGVGSIVSRMKFRLGKWMRWLYIG